MRVPFRLWFVALSVSTGLACGGERLSNSDGQEQEPYDPCADSQALTKVMIADFEAATPIVNAYPPNTPAPLEARKCAGDASPGSGLHIVATGLTANGTSFGFNGLNALPGAGGSSYFDASNWDGVSLWVRKGDGPSASTIFASIAERFTDPSGASLFTAAEATEFQVLTSGTYCEFNAMDVTGDGMNDPTRSQCDRFGVGVGLGKEWRFFKIPFDKMRQRAYGRPAPSPVPDNWILGLEFGLTGSDWDFWADEIAFYRDGD